MSALSISLLGSFDASLGDQLLNQFRTNKVQALLIYLVAEADTRHKREALMTLLWPGLPLSSARTNLRQILYQLRKAVPKVDAQSGGEAVKFVLTKGQNIGVNPAAAIDLDIARFKCLIEESRTHQHRDIKGCADCQERLEEAIALYRGDFLADFYLADSNLFEEWAQVKREALRRQMIDALNILTVMHMKPGHYAQAQDYARRQLAIDNLNEHATRQLMEALARSGQRSAAITVHDHYRQLLASELGMAPTEKTSSLYQQIVEDELGLQVIPAHDIRGYELLEEIGSGSFGVVHRAQQQVIDREVAVKIIQPKYANQPDFIRNFDAEAQMIARLEHPHIVPLYDFWREPDSAYLVMRWLRGGSLMAAMEQGPWSLDNTVTLLGQIAAALHLTHKQGIIHRDIKPANILLDEEGNAYLSDFGIAKDTQRADWQTMVVGLKGSPAYISPEQILFEDLSPLTDQYSLGIVTYEMLTGKRPFSNESIQEMIRQQINEPLPFISEQMPHIPWSIDQVIQKATAKKAQERYPDILVFAAAFREAAAVSAEFTPSTPIPIAEIDVDLPNPYKGLQAFQEIDAHLFFGRQKLVGQLINQLKKTRFLAVVGPSGSGKSSAVKAGLIPALREGALPGSENWFVAEMTPGSYPLEELEAALIPIAVNPPPSLLEPLQKDERGLSRTLKRILPVDHKMEEPSQLLLVIDQFEELFTLVEDPQRRTQFLHSLLTAINDPYSRLRVVVTLRADFYDRPLQVSELGDLMRRQTEIILPLSTAELEAAIIEPAFQAGVQLESGLASKIVADVADQPGALPLMQYALTEVFDHRIGKIMTHEAYQEIGGVFGALGGRAEEIYQEFDPAGQDLIRQQFLRLVTLGEGTEDTRRRILLSELENLYGSQQNGSQAAESLKEFGRYRLLTFDRDPISRAPTVEIAHESLIREWPRLASWLEESRDDVRQQRRLAAATAEWLASGKDKSFLLRGGRLDQFWEWAGKSSISLTEDEQDFLAASSNLRLAQQEAEEARRQRELETVQQLAETERIRAEEQTRAAQRLRRRALFLIGALLIAAILAVAAVVNGNRATQNANEAHENLSLAVSREAEAMTNFSLAATQESLANVNAQLAATRQAEAETEALARATAEAQAIQERETAQEQTSFATSRELALAALNNLEEDPELSILLALEALKNNHTKEAEEALHRALQSSRVITTLQAHEGGVAGAIYSPDGSLVATTGNDFTVKIWDPVTGELLHTLPFDGVEFAGETLDFDDASRQVAMVTVGEGFASAILHIWDAQSGELISQQELPITVENFSLTLSPDWQWIAAGHMDGTAELWHVPTQELVRTFSGYNDVVRGLDISSAGDRLALTSRDGRITLYDLPAAVDNTNTFPFADFNGTLDGNLVRAYFSNSGDQLAAVYSNPNSVEIWNLEDTSQPQMTIFNQVGLVTYVNFHPDDSMIVTGGVEPRAKIWDAQTGELLFTLDGHIGFVNRPNFSPDGQTIITTSLDGTSRIWNAQPFFGGELLTFPIEAASSDLVLSPDEELIGMGSRSGPATILDSKSGAKLFTLPGNPGTAVYSLAFHPQEPQITTVGEDGIVRVWDALSGELLFDFVGHTGGNSGGLYPGTLDVVYSPDGSRLATAGADGLAKVWDSQTGQELLTLAGHTVGLHAIAYSPNGQYIATSSDVPENTVKVWDAQTGAELLTLGPNPGRAWGLDFSPDSRMLAAGGMNGFIKVWALSSGQEISNMTGQSSTITTLEFTVDGEQLVSGSPESISLWDVAAGTESVNLMSGNHTRFDLTGDGQRLFGTLDQELATGEFVLHLDDTIALAQSRLTRSLTPDECRQYLHTDNCPQT